MHTTDLSYDCYENALTNNKKVFAGLKNTMLQNGEARLDEML